MGKKDDLPPLFQAGVKNDFASTICTHCQTE
jgi:hypothetical protein